VRCPEAACRQRHSGRDRRWSTTAAGIVNFDDAEWRLQRKQTGAAIGKGRPLAAAQLTTANYRTRLASDIQRQRTKGCCRDQRSSLIIALNESRGFLGRTLVRGWSAEAIGRPLDRFLAEHARRRFRPASFVVSL
jgi:hypothetical protein